MSKTGIKSRGTIIILAIALAVFPETPAFGAEAQTEILQFKSGRFYFAMGREALIYPNSEYTIYIGDDFLCSGKIEMSSLGVSYGFPFEQDIDITAIADMAAVIETADTDSVSAITLGAVHFSQAPYSLMFPDLFGLYAVPQRTDIFFTEAGNAINIKRYISAAEMQLDFEAGLIDGYFSYNSPRTCALDIITISASTPYYVGLLPNMATLYNQRGLMTTSLYYRVNDDNPGGLFDGDGAIMQNCPMAISGECPRPLEYNQTKGQQLLGVLKPFGVAVRIISTEREFQPTAMYFTDILWREKVETRLQLGRSGGDIYIAPIPILSDSLSLSFEYIASFLSRDTVAGRSINKNLRLLDNYINEIKAAVNPDRKLEYAAKSAELLWQDLGVFALYRPRVYFIHRENIGKAAFDKNGGMNLRTLVKLRLPDGS